MIYDEIVSLPKSRLDTHSRRRVAAIGRLELGRLNSRPKNLIHVTLGRFLSWPDAIDDEALSSFVLRGFHYNVSSVDL